MTITGELPSTTHTSKAARVNLSAVATLRELSSISAPKWVDDSVCSRTPHSGRHTAFTLASLTLALESKCVFPNVIFYVNKITYNS